MSARKGSGRRQSHSCDHAMGTKKKMEERRRLAPAKVWGTTLAILLTGAAGVARAQAADAPPPAAPAAPPAAPAAPPPPPVVIVAPPPATPPAAVATEAKPPTSTEAMPATRPDVLPPIDVGAWLRVGGIFQGQDPSKINDWHMDNAYVELHTGGKITKNIGVTLDMNANMANYAAGGNPVSVLDAIVSFDFIPEFHLWGGHLLVPIDRPNSSGPFFMLPWNYPGFLTVGATTVVAAPIEGPTGRNNGAVIWGDIQGGMLTYLAGVFDNGNPPNGTPGSSPLWSGRLRLALWDPEPGFWGNSSYFGDKDILSFSVGGQYEAHGSTTATGGDKAWAEFTVDGLLEKKLPGGAFFTGEAAYYLNNVNDGAVSNSLFVLAAYATPLIGVGHIQPLVRYQWADVKGNTGSNPWNLDAAVAYLIKGPAMRVLATYSHTSLGAGTTANSIQL